MEHASNSAWPSCPYQCHIAKPLLRGPSFPPNELPQHGAQGAAEAHPRARWRELPGPSSNKLQTRLTAATQGMNLYEAHKSLHFPCTDGSHAGKALLRSRDPGLPLAAGTAQGPQGQQGQQQPHPGDPRSRPALWAESATAGLASALPESARGWCREDGPGDDEGSAPGPQACTPQDGRLHWSVFPPTAPKHPRLSRLPGLVGSRDQPLTTLTDYRITVAAKQSHVSPTRLMAVQPEERGRLRDNERPLPAACPAAGRVLCRPTPPGT